MNYTNISILKDLTDSDDIIMQIIVLDAIQKCDYIIIDLAYEKDCDTDEITAQDCIEYLKSHTKRYDMLKQKFFKNRRFIIESIEELEELQKNGFLDKLPPEIEYEYRCYGKDLKQEQLQQFIGKNIIFRNDILSSKSFNMICANGFLFETPEYSEECKLDNIDIENIDETIKNVTKYKEKRFELKINIDSSNVEELRKIINSTLETENIELNIDINIDDEKELSNIIDILKDTKNIRWIYFHAHNDKISCVEQLLQDTQILNQTELSSKTYLYLNLDEEYIKSLNEEDIKKIDTYIEELKNSKIIVCINSTDPHLKFGRFGTSTERYESIGQYFMHYNKIQDIIGNIPQEASDIDKITYISNWIMQNFTYDYEDYYKLKEFEREYKNIPLVGENYQRYLNSQLKKITILDFLESKKGVCEDVAILTEYLLRKVGVECELVSSNNHSFNVVYIEGVPYWLDNTWDVNWHDSNESYKLSSSQFFLTSSEDFYKTHSKYDLSLYECPETIDREVIKDSLQRTAGWEHIVDKSIEGDELYSKTRTSLLTRIGETFKRFFNRETKENEKEENRWIK